MINLDVYYMIDDWQNPNDQDKRVLALEVADRYACVHVIERRSIDAAMMFKEDEVDAVYLDACHDFASVYQDIEAWWPVASKLLSGHDYINWNTCMNCPIGVVPAVEKFAVEHALQVNIDGSPMMLSRRLQAAYEATYKKCETGDSFPSWFILK
jgi:hypothetical protein